jgi:DMSO/TMAO reductase YedYZ molybdopterin-dependent catalytic subunit
MLSKLWLLPVSLVLLVLVSGCVQSTYPGEVGEYNGQVLSPISALREVSIAGPQYINIDSYSMEVFGLVEEPKNFTYDEILAHQTLLKVVDLNCVLGWSANILWEGVLLEDLFNSVGVRPEAVTVIFHAEDGYTSSLPMDFILDNNIIIAYSINNITLPQELGFPFQVVAEEKYGYKWVKWITRIELSDDPDYEGFWESSGYSNDADISEPY